MSADKAIATKNNQDSHSKLNELLSIATSAYDDFDDDYAQIIITIGKGMFWSKEFDMKARALAMEVEKEFERIEGMSTVMENEHPWRCEKCGYHTGNCRC